MRKTTALLAGGIGYVLGARAGRERYEQIVSFAQRMKSNPKVQQSARQAADAATSKIGSSSHEVPMEDSAYPRS